MSFASQWVVRARHVASALRRDLALRRAVARVRRLRAGDAPSPSDLARLRAAFGNDGWSAGVPYLEELCRLVGQTHGAILECGSGVTTLLLAALTESDQRPVLALEHLPDWHARMRRDLFRLGAQGFDLRCLPLASYGAFDWYRRPLLPPGLLFSLVACDGPPGQTRGGRYGLLEVMSDHLADECVILLDDAQRESEQQVVRRWKERFRVVETHGCERYVALLLRGKEAPLPGAADPRSAPPRAVPVAP
ncbi:MAG: hypothetical protein HY812_14790 [Planctomycetes bacterium]|nr:hypothetical protein [Planctomycetota bacterium]